MGNKLWGKGQPGKVEDVLSTVDQLLIDVCFVDGVITHKRNFAMAYYDKKMRMTIMTI